MRQNFRQDEAEEILRAAVRRSVEQGGPGTVPTDISAERLRSMAAELGIDEESLDAIIHERTVGEYLAAERQSEAKLRELFIGERRHEFVPHAIAYVFVSALLIFLNLISTTFPWALIPMLSWGIGFAIHGWMTVPTRGPAFEASFDRWRRKRSRRDARRRDDEDE